MTSEQQLNSVQTAHPVKGYQPRVARVIAISSGKGGVGKSSISLNLAVALSRLKNKVCIFDADTNLANINIMTGLSPDHTLHDYLTHKVQISDILLKGPRDINIIPAASGVMDFIQFDEAQQRQLISLIKRLESDYDFVLIDTAAGINETVLSFLQAAPETIITITTEPTSLTDAFSLLKVLKQRGFNRPVQVLVNKAQSYQAAKEVLSRFSRAVKKYLGLKIVAPGYVLEDRNVARSIMLQKPFSMVYPNSPASLCIKSFAHKLNDKNDIKEASLSDYFSRKKQLVENSSEANRDPSSKAWMADLVSTIESAPFDEAEQLMALISTHWISRVEEEIENSSYLNSEGFKAAIRFASKLNG